MSDDFKKHHLPKPCKFCGQGAGYHPLKQMDKYGMDVYFCHVCQAEYVYYQSGTLSGFNIYIKINNKTYRWSSSPDGKTASVWHIGEPGVPGVKANRRSTCLKQFSADAGDIFPSITPQNIESKLRTWLVFL